jgi:hypothetical protein
MRAYDFDLIEQLAHRAAVGHKTWVFAFHELVFASLAPHFGCSEGLCGHFGPLQGCPDEKFAREALRSSAEMDNA